LRSVAGGIGPGRGRTREQNSEIIRTLNDLFYEGVSEGDKIKQAANLLATSKHARRNRAPSASSSTQATRKTR
jgi:putative ubiquitin-RnfH superfamily antitoxin RatB of RatAB toxin-antitoxin module